ncbi:type III-A CRISPR-associated protein Cas10/Csm1 [Pasteurella atlantica]|uniref:Type III-A CRISPR-associated protein Cas10/Csm1 n=2 Tax=Pasteurellaceae TaxID=712 RepID=A0ACC6HMB8_9PAST|nr:type III-A CRISPR-associated protein Cas10/Csm1 [Pasteurella atlantica]MDP8052019.1 type III-A CRISPR-associated protein Cas10/Csm1 [Pasteurella atlantica]MDP8105462.1 type III-A CRISPR-associated protein Cas10/Csm1 [Pasteurella atlantica]MDP8148795.1 type III-A CRISPR-associated protein Cas10/Csm1 [Pasteurella atlantica]
MTTSTSKSCQIVFLAMISELEKFAKVRLPIIDTPYNLLQMSVFQVHQNLQSCVDEDDLQWAISVANNIVSESSTEIIHSNNQTHLLSLFEGINLDENKKNSNNLSYFYSINQLSANTIFPEKKLESKEHNEDILSSEYLALWHKFFDDLASIPISYKENQELWLDHFDSACECYLSNLPSLYNNEISLYDHIKIVASLTVSLYKNKENEKPFLLISGDFFGIQDFIFAGGRETNKQAAKLLRGRSFQVSLFTELAGLKVLQALGLPSTSQILNVAGKFLIVAPNTDETQNKIDEIRKMLDEWFIKNTYGLAGLGLAVTEADVDDLDGENFEQLQKHRFAELEKMKLQRFDLTQFSDNVQNIEYLYGCCDLNQYFPAQSKENQHSVISEDQIKIGKNLVKKDRLFVCDYDEDIKDCENTQILDLDIFGYKVVFTKKKEETGKFSKYNIHRFWDFSIPEKMTDNIFNGYARRYINGYVATDDNKEVISFDDLATKDQGQVALMTLKGDVDNLGKLFENNAKSFTRMTALSRKINQFFSLWLPAYCNEHKANIYTVFAGGDDFFLIGSWHSTQKVAFEMQQAFKKYVAENSQIHFSVGMVMTKVGYPVPRLGELAEETLEKSKAIEGKNAVTIFDSSTSWNDWGNLIELEEEIEQLAKDYNISTSYLYSLINLSKQAERQIYPITVTLPKITQKESEILVVF